jgi:hypothetical protein
LVSRRALLSIRAP